MLFRDCYPVYICLAHECYDYASCLGREARSLLVTEIQVPRSRPDRGSEPVICLHLLNQLPAYLQSSYQLLQSDLKQSKASIRMSSLDQPAP